MSLIAEAPYRFDEFELDTSRRLLTRDGERLSISPKSFEVLLYLVQHAGKVVLKEELLKAVWPDSFVEESNLTQHIFWLRKALKDRASCIATIPGRGYEFTAKVQTETALTPPEAISRVEPMGLRSGEVHLHLSSETTRLSVKETLLTPSLPVTSAIRPSRRPLWITASSGVLLLTFALVGYWYRQHRIVPGDHHEVVLADFTNATSDHDFDRTLKTLLSIDLSQSPYLIVATDPEIHDTLNLMGKPPDTPMTVPVALEVCQRMNDQVVLSGQIASFGNRYAVSLSAMDCQSGRALVQSKSIADNREAVVQAVEDVAATVRRRLGELPLQSTVHPLQPVHTVSLEALRYFSQAMDMQTHEREAIPLFLRAVEIDPQFAWGYVKLAEVYDQQSEPDLQKQYLEKAYSMRDQLNEYQRFVVTNEYNVMMGVDAQRLLLNLQSWSTLYPNQDVPLDGIVDVLESMGRFEDAIAPARRALALQPNHIAPYIELSTVLAEAGHPHEAKAVCEQAFRKNLDSIHLHTTLYRIAIHEHDSAGMAAQDAWARTQEDGVAFPVWRLMGEGKANEALSHMNQSLEDLRRQGFQEHADRRLRLLMHREAMYDMNSKLYEQMKSVDVTKYPENLIFVVAAMGRIKDAQTELRLLSCIPQKEKTENAEVSCAEPKAAVAMALHKPQDAIEDLEPMRKYGMAAPEAVLMRSQAYLDAGKPELAESEFQYLLDHSYLGLGFNEAIARLGLARAITRKGDVVNGKRAYEAVFEQWKDADPDLPLLLEAQREYGQINPPTNKRDIESGSH